MKLLRHLTLGLLIISAAFPATVMAARSWQDEVIYFMITDRFYDGAPSNNSPIGAAPRLYDPKQSDIDLYHGGDFRGSDDVKSF